MQPPVFLRPAEAAAQLQITRRTLDTYIKSGIVPAIKLGGSVRIRQDELNDALRSTPVAPVPTPGGKAA